MKLQDGQPLVIDIAGAEVSLSAAVITEMFLDRLRSQDSRNVIHLLAEDFPPHIGAPWRDGIYAGLSRRLDGPVEQVDQHLLILGEAPEEINYKDAMAWAESIGGVLPTRRELALCFANVPELFEKTAYWSGEPCAGDEAYAWSQDFYYGSQYYYHRDDELRARAVRRLTI